MAPYDPQNVLNSHSTIIQVAVLDSDPLSQPIPIDAHVVEYDVQSITLEEFKRLFYSTDGVNFKLNSGARDSILELQTKSIKGTPVALTSVVLNSYSEDLELDLDCLDPNSLIDITTQLSQYNTMSDLCKVTSSLSFPEIINQIYRQQPSYERVVLADSTHNFVINVRITNVGDVKDIIVKYNFGVVFSVSAALNHAQSILDSLIVISGYVSNPFMVSEPPKPFETMNALEQLTYLDSATLALTYTLGTPNYMTHMRDLNASYRVAKEYVSLDMTKNKSEYTLLAQTFDETSQKINKLFTDTTNRPNVPKIIRWHKASEYEYGGLQTFDHNQSLDANVNMFMLSYDNWKREAEEYDASFVSSTSDETANQKWYNDIISIVFVLQTAVEERKNIIISNNNHITSSISSNDYDTGDSIVAIDNAVQTIQQDSNKQYIFFSSKILNDKTAHYDVGKIYSPLNGGFAVE